MVCLALACHLLTPLKIELTPVLQKPIIYYAAFALIAAVMGISCMLFAMKNVSATYAAIGELGYPFFTAVFAYLIFHERQAGLPTMVGGALIFLGCLIVVIGKMKVGG